MGATRDEQEEFHLLKPQDYYYLNQVPPIYSHISLPCPQMFSAAAPLSLCAQARLATNPDPDLDE